MYWHDEVKEKIKRKNKILFRKDSEFLYELNKLLKNQNKRIITLWAFDFAEESINYFEKKFPFEKAPRNALKSSILWAQSKIKMPQAKQDILACYAFAKQISDPEYIALCHAIAQACSVVHTTGHAMGYPIYELTSLVNRYGLDNCINKIELRKRKYIDHLLYHRKNYTQYKGEWASFM